MTLAEDVIAQRANLIRSEREVERLTAKLMRRLLGRWRAVLADAVSSNDARKLQQAARYSKLMREAGYATDVVVKQFEALVRGRFADVMHSESFRSAANLSGALGFDLQGISRRAAAQAAKGHLPGISQLTSFANLAGAARKRMADDVADAIAEGWKVNKLVAKWTNGAGAGRIVTEANALARTSLMAASNQAMIAVARQSGSVSALRWEATFDARTCPICGSRHGKVYPFDRLPLLPAHLNCRCVWLPVLKDAAYEESVDKPVLPPDAPGLAAGSRRSFEVWLKKQPPGVQADFFGSELKRDVWKSGKLSLEQIAPDRVLTDSEIRALVPGFGAAPPPPVPVPPPPPPPAKTAADIRKDIVEFERKLGDTVRRKEEESKKYLEQIDAQWSEHARISQIEDPSNLNPMLPKTPEAKARIEELQKAWAKHAEMIDEVLTLKSGRDKQIRALLSHGEAGASIEVTEAESLISKRPDGTTRWVTGVEPITLNVLSDQKAAQVIRENSEKAADFLRSVIKSDVIDVQNGVDFRVFATSWKRGAHYNDGAIFMRGSDGVNIHIHEMSHGLEEKVPGWLAKAVEFRESRTAGESPQSMQKLSGWMGYASDELVKPDKFRSPYAGKLYQVKGTDTNTEIITMGFQWLYEDAAAFARDDPEYFDFIISLARGLR